ncbi:MAG: mechanosensitive ion channel family protein [Paludibacter sp.]|jgi:small-conductance mechanosensitive channel|nr:mechanosensitive ion channel family protein [Paludibacter sp.]
MNKILYLLFFLCSLFFVNARAQSPSADQIAVSETAEKVRKAYPVVFYTDTLFFINSRLASLTAEERAEKISARLEKIFDENTYSTNKIITSQNGSYVDIICGETIIMSVSENDALSKGVGSMELAEEYIQQIQTAINKAKKDRSFVTIIIRIGLVLLVLAGIWLMIFLIKKGHLFVVDKITINKNKWLRNLSYKDYTFLTAEQELSVVFWLLKVLKWAVIIILIYLLLPMIFSIFPFSRGWAATLFGFVWGPFKAMMLSVWNYLPELFAIIVIYVIFKYLIRFVKYVFTEIESGKLVISGFHADWALPTFSIIKFLMYAFMFVLIFPYLPGSNSPIFQGVSVFLGLLVSLGSSSAIGNMVAGLVITYMRPFKIGDRIKIGDVTGNVIEKTLLVTRLRTIKNEEITIPNSAVLSGNTTNYSAMAKEEGLIIHTTVTIGYDVHWKAMHEALLEAASRTTNLMKSKKPFVLQTSLDDFYVSYQLNVYTNESNALASIYSELHQHILDVCAAKGIEIMSPHYRAERDGNELAIPKSVDDSKKAKK